jgi:hypothetical protein
MTTNYAKVYEFKLNSTSTLNYTTLAKRVRVTQLRKRSISTTNGTFYIKDFKELDNSIIFLFGKDNDDASNYKREKISNNIEKIDINEDTEVLTDFVHIAVSKEDRLGTYTLLLEKSSLISHFNLSDFLRDFFTTPLSFSLSRRVTDDFHNEVLNANRIITITQVSKAPKPPVFRRNSRHLKNVDISANIELKAKRSESISKRVYRQFVNQFSSDPTTKLVVDIVNNDGNRVLLDFDVSESPYTIKVQIEDNLKTDFIQDDIAENLNSFIINEME